ncbi:F-box/LRR-repeat protein At3g26922-like [Salvia miltiorrhiza]|uniref:F-box/LRR-repeat protein At3g26922-like n=1 Tax=Salvia miltiorrhiza TaxID=226208 RepID=UPI0025ABDCDE|nr:F-box/LRR-repeat protein At3g26922-like [Salvia miltiorrhiza]
MTNSKRCKHHDRLSELPNAVIFEIFWLMPMTDVVRTTVLSKRWRDLWTITPFLNFDNRTMLFDDDRLRKFVNRALLCWDRTRVLKFKFLSHKLGDSMVGDVDLWLRFAQRYGVEELSLVEVVQLNSANWVPQCLYSCSSLKAVWLFCGKLEISGNVQWNQLERLTLTSGEVNAHTINQILSGSPQLRVFTLRYNDRGGNLSIQSNSLKELLIRKYPVRGFEDLVSELRICTPNLEKLELGWVNPYTKCLLMNVSSLSHATLRLWGSCVFELIKYDLHSGEALSQILPTIQHVENVRLLNWSTKGLGAMKMNSSFPNVKSLELRCCSYDYKRVVGVLELFPKLERLVLQYQKEDGHQDHIESLNLPESFVLQLRTVDVTWAEGDDVFPLIEIILKYASKLEKIVFRLIETKSPSPPSDSLFVFRLIETKSPSPPSDSLFLLSQKLLGMRRSSANCTIDLTKLPSKILQ